MMLDKAKRKVVSKLFVSLAIFWLTTVPVSLITGITDADISIMNIVEVCLVGATFALVGVFVTPEDEKDANKEVIQTEIKKGIFHIRNAEIKTDNQDNSTKLKV